MQQDASLKSLKCTTVIRQFCKDISHSCLIYFVTLCDVLFSLLCIGTDSASGFSTGVHTAHGTELRVFLLVCGLRRVKDPLYLVEDFSGKSKNLSVDMSCRYCIYMHAKTPDSRRNVELQRSASTIVAVILTSNRIADYHGGRY